jgi:hypothetical protein
MSAVTATLKAVLASRRLRLVFGTILHVGNFLNSGTTREHADAFDVVREIMQNACHSFCTPLQRTGVYTPAVTICGRKYAAQP